ncbi:MAG: glycosyltransferase family 4 protein [Rhodocyclales bacterium]|nr:glycosyltransferase family 4 protein [Rhodocyclales bacterium]
MLSVLMFCPQFRPVVGGAERQAEKLANALVSAGCRVTIVTPRIDSESPDIEESGGVRIERFPLTNLSRRFPFPGIALLNIPSILWQVASAVRMRLTDNDVLHCHLASLQTAGAALAGRLGGIPVLCKAAVADQRSDLGEIEKTGVSGHLLAWLIRTLITNWIATTEGVEQALVRAGVTPKQIVRIPNGVDLSGISAQHSDGNLAHRFLYLGRLSKNIRRDVPTLIRAFDRLAVQHPDVELALVGSGDLFEETFALVTACEARDRIQMPGLDDADKWLSWADCFVLPSRIEGLSNALLEAMAAGLPCIANDIPPNREVLVDGVAGTLVPVGDEERLLEAMQRMASDAAHVHIMRAAALNRVRSHYGIESVASRYIALYEELIRNSDR